MREQRGMLKAMAATVVTLALAAGCGSGSSAPETQSDAPETTASEGTIAPSDASDPAPVADARVEPSSTASGLAPANQSSVDRSLSRQPAARPSDPAVAPSPTIGGAPVRAGSAASSDTADAARAPSAQVREAAPVARLVELPAGTVLPLRLGTTVGSATSAVEDPVTARVTRDVTVGGDVLVPEGSTVSGRVTYAQNSGRVKGRAGLTVRFYTLTIGDRAYDIDAEPLRREAQGTKGKDAQKIGIGAGAGAVVGGLLGGRKGAAIGAVAGGAGGTGVVLATKGEEVELAAGTAVDLRLTSSTTLTR